MADFCKQCSLELFATDFHDLRGTGDGSKLEDGYGWQVLCEGCGPTIVNDAGECIATNCLEKHKAA